MGYLDHSTNNIIVDAVLTDAGRKRLARNDGSFSIFQFALGDDEVDYSIIQQYGRTVGKEKIEKNTPVMEGLTASGLALKHRLASVSNEYVTHYPVLTMVGKLSSTNIRTLTRTGKTSMTLYFNIANTIGTNIEDELADFQVFVELDNRFLRLVGLTAQINRTDNTSVYIVDTDRQSDGSLNISFNLALKSFGQTTFQTYSVSNASYIRSFVKVTGMNSGVTKTMEIQIKNS